MSFIKNTLIVLIVVVSLFSCGEHSYKRKLTKEQIEHLFDKSKVKANKGNEADEPVDFDEEKIHLDDDKPVNEQPSGDKHYFFNMGMITQEWWEHPDGSVTVKVRAQCTACRGSLVCNICQGTGNGYNFLADGSYMPCPNCGATGQCGDCHGTGYVSNRKTIEVTVPAGIDNGQSIRIRGKGEPGTNGGPRGDLLVEVIVERHPKFQRQDTTIYSTEPISFTQAALGGKIQIPTVDGPYEYTIKPGTQTDTRIRLKGKGVPMVRNKNVRGDHYVTLVVQVPEHLNGEQRAALQKFQEAMGEVPKKEEAHKEHKGFFGKHKK